MNKFDGVKVFSATQYADREVLGDRVTTWLTEQASRIEIVDIVTTQSSDNAYHCIAISVFYRWKSQPQGKFISVKSLEKVLNRRVVVAKR